MYFWEKYFENRKLLSGNLIAGGWAGSSWINTSKKGVFSWVLEHCPDKPAIRHPNSTKQAHFKPGNCRILPVEAL
jgi:hypothetical protein